MFLMVMKLIFLKVGELSMSSNKFSVTESAETKKITEALELIKNKTGDTVMLPLRGERKGGSPRWRRAPSGAGAGRRAR